MTIAQAVENFDTENPNEIPYSLKIRWLSQLDGKIFAEMLTPRGDGDFSGYGEDTPSDTTLAAPDIYGEIYVYFLRMNSDLFNREIDRFNNSAMLFNRCYKELFDYVNRTRRLTNTTKISAGDLIV